MNISIQSIQRWTACGLVTWFSTGCVPGEIIIEDDNTTGNLSTDESEDSGDGDLPSGDGDGDPGDGDGDEPISPCNFPLEPCPNNDCGVDGRRSFSDMDCGADGCTGLWSGTDSWSKLIALSELADFEAIDKTTVWACNPDPDVDECLIIDQNGHIACFRYDGEFAVIAWPSCATANMAAVDVGNGMCSSSVP
jgi:hypothetical protein